MRRQDVTLRVQCDEPGCVARIDVEGSSLHACEEIAQAPGGWHLGSGGGCDFCPAHNTQAAVAP